MATVGRHVRGRPVPTMPTDALEELPGRTLAGRYRLDRLIAAGGMARVFQATDLVLNRRVAVKVLHHHLASDPAFVLRFRREAQAAARLNHPAIVAIYDTCAEADLEAIVMEFVAGITLRERLDRGPMEPHVAVGIVAQVADALEAAHQAQIVHRDIKPANVLLCRPDTTADAASAVPRVMVTDFGIAKSLVGDEGAADLTRVGSMLGTAKYLAPEQVRGEPVDARTDVYALGVVLYEAVCGRPPFVGDSDLSVALARLNGDPKPPRQLRSMVRRDLEAVILRALARDPEHRFASAAHFRAALLAADPGPADVTAVLDPEPDPASVPSFVQSERGWLLPALGVLLAAALLIGGGVVVGQSNTGRAIVDRALGAVGAREATTTTTAAVPVGLLPVVTARGFDPAGAGGLKDEIAGRAIDGDPSTAWRTQCYFGNMAGKPGVGLIVGLPGDADVHAVEVEASTGGWQAELYVASSPARELSGWGEPVAQGSGGTRARFEVEAHRGRAVLVWITSMAGVPPSDCFGEPGLAGTRRVEISSVRVFGR